MTISQVYLQGNPEPFDETIRHLLARNWVQANTENKLPNFLSPHGSSTNAAGNPKSANAIKIQTNNDVLVFSMGKPTFLPKESSDDGSVHAFETPVFVNIYAETQKRMYLYEEEIDRILMENEPGTFVRIKKSDNTNASAIAKFRTPPGPHIEYIEVGKFSEKTTNWHASGMLFVNWYKQKT